MHLNIKLKDREIKKDFWFPTPVYSQQIPDYKELNKYLLKHIKIWKKQDPKGLAKTNKGMKGGGWHSKTDMHTKSEFKPLIKYLEEMQNVVTREEGFVRDMFIGNMWTNINYPGCYNRAHIHPNSHFTGVYYIQVPKDANATLSITDPRHGLNMFSPKQLPTPKIPRFLWRGFEYDVREGNLLMFPSFVEHDAGLNQSKQKGEKNWRISVSFNLVQKGMNI